MNKSATHREGEKQERRRTGRQAGTKTEGQNTRYGKRQVGSQGYEKAGRQAEWTGRGRRKGGQIEQTDGKIGR